MSTQGKKNIESRSRRFRRSSLKQKKRSKNEEYIYPAGKCDIVSDRYEKIGRIGEGTYGVVYKARDRKTKGLVALKRCIPHHESSDGFPITTLREIEFLRLCAGHPNIVELYQVSVSDKGGVFLVFEHCDNDLADVLDEYHSTHKTSPFDLAAAKQLFRQLLSALDHLHSRHVIHRDLKLSNLLYRQGQLKLADFGLARSFPPHSHSSLTPGVASLWYRPPELLLGAKRYTQSIDLWAAGCIWTELLQGYPLLTGRTEVEQWAKIVNALGVPRQWPESLTSLALVREEKVILPLFSTTAVASLLDQFSFLTMTGLRLLTSLLCYDSDARWTARQALESPYFQESPLPTPVESMKQFR